jgi:hypothetical protein
MIRYAHGSINGETCKMRFKKYIVVVPMVGSKLDLLSYGEKGYTWLCLWHDMRSLHGKCISQASLESP